MITRVVEVTRIETDLEIRCTRCNRGLARQATRPWSIMCPRCKLVNLSRLRPTEEGKEPEERPKPTQPTAKKRSRRRKKLDTRSYTN